MELVRWNTPRGTSVPDTRVRYGRAVTGRRQIDRAAWARVVDKLVTTEAGGNQTCFGALVGVTPKTVGRWLRKQVDVSEEAVRGVANALNQPPLPLLVEVGYYTADEATGAIGQTAGARDDRDPEIQVILNSGVSDDLKTELVAHVKRRREEDQRRRMDDIQLILKRGGGLPAH